jgi:alpha-glucoside transport system substrate-binding protein
MPTFDRRNRRDLDQLVEEYITTNNINRRQFLQRATAAGLSISGAMALLQACGGGSTSPGAGGTPAKVTSLDALSVWSGSELAIFNSINAAFTQKTGIKVNVESTRDVIGVLNTRVRANNPPDLSGMPTLALFHDLASKGKVLQLDTFFDMTQYRQSYSQTWIDLGSVNGKLYAVFPKASSKATVWYNPKQFQANGYTVPTTFDELIALSDKIAGQGKYPWTMGVESGAASGWSGADWIDMIYLNLNGLDMSNKWINHKIPWTDPSVKNAFQMYGQIVNGKHYIQGAPQSILATNFLPATYLPFESPPKAYMYFLGDFAKGFIKAQFPSLTPGPDYNFFQFPTINPQFTGAVVGGPDIFAALKDNEGTRQYMKFMASAEAQAYWVKGGAGSSVNKSLDPSAYTDDVARAAAKLLQDAPIFSQNQDDAMPAAMETAYWKGVLSYIQKPGDLDSILSSLESTAMSVYTS